MPQTFNASSNASSEPNPFFLLAGNCTSSSSAVECKTRCVIKDEIIIINYGTRMVSNAEFLKGFSGFVRRFCIESISLFSEKGCCNV